MADTGEDREIKQRVNAHQAEMVRESKQLKQRKESDQREKEARRTMPGRSRSKKPISRAQPGSVKPSDL